jgi:hypothetical protein
MRAVFIQERIAQLMAQGQVRSLIDATCPPAALVAAHERSRSFCSRGQRVLAVR